MDNLFLFWEAIALACKKEENLAILLLHFEKAYDQFDWEFHHYTLIRLGFPLIKSFAHYVLIIKSKRNLDWVELLTNWVGFIDSIA